MPSAPRTNVPPLNTPPAGTASPGTKTASDDDDGSVLEFSPGFAHDGLDRFKDSGDMVALRDASFGDWEWVLYRLRSPKEMNEQQTRRQRVLITKLVGPLDVTQVQAHCGGGVFEIRGFLNAIMRARFTVELAGAMKNWDTVSTPGVSVSAPPPAAIAAPVAYGQPSDTERRLMREARRQRQDIARLTDAVSRMAPPAQPQSMEIAEIFKLADQMSGRMNPNPESGVLNQVVDAFKQGMDMRGQLEGAPEATTMDKIIDKGLPVVERLIGSIMAAGMAARRRPTGPGSGPGVPVAVRPASSAEVVDQATTAEPVAAAPADGEHRWATATESLARAVAENADPVEFASTLEDILAPHEIVLLVETPPEQTAAMLRENAGARFPILLDAAAGAFIAATVAELARPVEA